MENTPLDHSTIDEQEKRSAWFEKISIRDLSGEQKQEIAKTIIDDINTGIEYRSQMGLSALIAALGLLINATPVVIGAMLIAPIMRPIQGVSFATTSGNKRLFFQSIWILALSIGLSIVISIVLTWIVPLAEMTNEIAMRIDPTLIDLGIAFASGLVAFLAFGWKKMSAGLAGVAMAASLVPPLAVIGIGIGFGNLHIAWGSMILFMTNLIAIIIAGIGVFYLFGFHPTQKDDLKRSVINLTSAIIMMAIIAIPLASSLVRITKNIATQRILHEQVINFFHEIDDNIIVENITTDTKQSQKNVSLTVKVPQSKIKNITTNIQEELTKQLATSLHDDVQLDMVIIPFTSISEIQAKTPSPERKIKTKTTQFLQTLYHDVVYPLQIRYIDTPKKIVVATFYADHVIDKAQFQKQYTQYLQEAFPFIDKILVNRETQYKEDLPPTEQQTRIKNITDNFNSFFPETQLLKINVDHFKKGGANTKEKLIISLWLNTPLQKEQLQSNIRSRKIQLEELYPNTTIQIKTYVSYLQHLEEK